MCELISLEEKQALFPRVVALEMDSYCSEYDPGKYLVYKAGPKNEGPLLIIYIVLENVMFREGHIYIREKICLTFKMFVE